MSSEKIFKKLFFHIAWYPMPCLFLEIQVFKKAKDIFFLIVEKTFNKIINFINLPLALRVEANKKAQRFLYVCYMLMNV